LPIPQGGVTKNAFLCFRKRIFSPFPDVGIRSVEVREGGCRKSPLLVAFDMVYNQFRTARIASKDRPLAGRYCG
jgi:hypothetical protein